MPAFCKKIQRRQTGLPVLVNTSFNVHEEPIVCRPEECLSGLLDRRIDFVVTLQGVYRCPPGAAFGHPDAGN